MKYVKFFNNQVNAFIRENRIIDLKKYDKDVFINFIFTNENLNQIIIKNISNISEMENLFEEEITNNCVSNLKKSK